MATLLSKTFDTAHGAVNLQVQDSVLGNVSFHTAYLANIANFDTYLAQTLSDADAQAQAVKTNMIAAGWTPSP